MTMPPFESRSSSGALRSYFDAVIELPAADRAKWMDAHVADPVMRERLHHLLVAMEDLGALDVSAADRAARIGQISTVAAEHWIGRRVGAFRLVRQIGEGGMAVVFLGERDDPALRQRVAVKLLRRSLISGIDQRMFLRERQALAALSHPNIARFIDGGVADGGVPFLVLEYVDGLPIDQHAASARLGVRARVLAMVDACHAVAAAHRALIVHRDLKPSNILVDANGQVKLLDFGIAKMLDDGSDVAQTEFAVMTPAYAAPEQRDAGVISTATDVFSLGAVLYELLLGRRPRIGDTQRASADIDATSLASAGLPTDSLRVRSELIGDLDNILDRALDSEPARRYPDAAALVDDLQRFLDGRPVLACPPSRRYRLRKFVSRHKGAVASSLGFLIALLVALGVALWQAQVAREQARIARSQSVRADATRDFVVELLQTASADLPKDQRPTPEALVNEAARKAREEPDLDPLVRVQLLLTLSKVARSNSDFATAEGLIEEAIERIQALGLAPTTEELISALVAKGNLLHSTGRAEEADRLMAELVPQLADIETEAAVSALMLYGATRAAAGDAERAAGTAQAALAKAQRVFGADSANGIETATYLGQLTGSMRQYRQSAEILDEATARWRRLGLPLNEQFARSLFHLAVAKDRLEARSQVEPLYREGIALLRRVHQGPYHRLAPALIRYARFLIEDDRFDEAAAAIQEAIDINQAVFGPDHVETAASIGLRGLLHAAKHQNAEAATDTYAAYLVLRQHAKQAGHEDRLAALRLQWAELLLNLGRLDEAEDMLAEASTELEQWFEASSPESVQFQRLAARLDLRRGDASRALLSVDRALAAALASELPAPMAEIQTRGARAEILFELSRGEDAVQELDRALARQRISRPAAHSVAIGLLALRARIERAQGNLAALAETIAQAHALGVPSAYVRPADREVLQIDYR
ncbi:MAG: serine/threonine protein kinase [Flavobacteriales bacterium]|nr:MAG: serine/threonine protein kinase [Flavobacteriales bacterium]